MKQIPTLTRLLETHAATDATMLIHEGRNVSFADMLDQSRRLATGLRKLGVQPGDRVAIWLPTTPAWLATLLACARLGAIAVAVNTRYVARELTDIVGRSGARVMVCWPGFPKVDFASILAGCDHALTPALQAIVAYGEAGDVPRPAATGLPTLPYEHMLAEPPMAESIGQIDSPLLIWTTSGTTKAPKFVLHDQRSIVGHALDVVVAHGYDDQTVLLMAPPICGAFGSCVAMAMLAAGRPMITAPVWDPVQAAASMDRYGVTHLHGVDDAFAQMLDQNDRTPAFPTFRYGGYAAFNPARKGIVARAAERGVRMVGMYGTSEIQGLFSRQSELIDVDDRTPGGGYPVSPLVRVRARDPDTVEILPHGIAGELEFFAPTSRMVGYFGNPQATAAAFTEDGYYRSGDLGFTLEDGRFSYIGRTLDTLRLGGFLVSPREIESVVEEVHGIAACQVIDVSVDGVPRPFAFVQMVDGAELSPPAVIDYCAARLARYKVPSHVVEIAEFPRTDGTNGLKIQKNKLRDLAPRYLA